MTLSDNIRKEIRKAGIKQVDVCRACGLSPSRLSNYLSGSREPDFETLGDICDFLGVSMDSLRTDTPEITPHDKALSILNSGLAVSLLTVTCTETEASARIYLSSEIAHMAVIAEAPAKLKEVTHEDTERCAVG